MSPKKVDGAGEGVGMSRGREIPLVENKKIKVVWFIGFVFAWFLGFFVSWFLVFLVSWLLRFEVSKFQKKRSCFFQDIGPILQNCHIAFFEKILVPYSIRV